MKNQLLENLLIVSIVKKFGEDIVRDHDHFNGKFRGYAHNICNLNSKKSNLFHYTFIMYLNMTYIFSLNN